MLIGPGLVRNTRHAATPPAAPPPSGDALFAQVAILCHFNTITDQGLGISAFPCVVDGGSTLGFVGGTTGATQETGAPLLGAGSLKLATVADYAHIQKQAGHAIAGSDDFTLEFWLTPTTLGVNNILMLDDGGHLDLYCEADGKLHFYRNGAEAIVSSAGVLVSNTVAKIALARASGTTKLFANGVVIGSIASDTQAYTAAGSWSYQFGAGGNGQPGLYDEFRLTVGTARYTGAYTPETAAFPDAA